MSDTSFRSRYGPWALVAGASEGLGAAFARELAARGFHLVLVARRPGPLEEQARNLVMEFGIEARTVPVDLATADLMSALGAQTRDVEIGLLIYNAAFSPIGLHLEQALEDKLQVVDVNCRAPLVLIHEYGRPMVGRGKGGIILMSSVTSFQGAALIATYAGTKAYNRVLGEGLWDELRDRGVDVLSCCAGATRTPNFEASQPKRSGFLSAPMEAAPVVTEALAALGKRPTAIAGWRNRLAAFIMTRFLSRRAAVGMIGRALRSLYAD
jgi:short-subunit dehydrogenase